MAIMKTVEDTEKVTIPAADIADIRYIKINKDITRGRFFTENIRGKLPRCCIKNRRNM